MVDLEAVWMAPAVVMVQAVPLREEVLDRTDGRGERGAYRFVRRLELRVLAAATRTLVMQAIAPSLERSCRRCSRAD